MSLTKIRILSLIALTSLSLPPALQGDTPAKHSMAISQAQDLIQNHKWTEAETLLLKALETPLTEGQENFHFQLGLTQMNLRKNTEASSQFKLALGFGENLIDYSTFYMAQIAEKENDLNLAEKLYRDIGGYSPNIHLKIEAHKNLAKILLEKQDFKNARALLTPLEKQVRGGDESAPVILYQLALAEKGLKNQTSLCKWIRKLYTKFPTFERTSNWGTSLSVKAFEGEQTKCSMSEEDFKARTNKLISLGSEAKALIEIQAVRNELATQDPYLGDEHLARFYLQQGEALKALELLKVHLPKKQKNIEFLLNYAVAATRSGQNAAGVGAYYQAHLLAPRSSDGRRALYQAAFLSYQNQDYDGASRKFQEFVQKYGETMTVAKSKQFSSTKKNRRSNQTSSSSGVQKGLIKDAQWYLAWLKYLRGDYSGAYQSLSLTQTTAKNPRNSLRKSSPVNDRTRYWMAMSLLRMSRQDEALPIFENLAQDPLQGYYSLVARGRVKQIKLKSAAQRESLLDSQKTDPRFQDLLRAAQDDLEREKNDSVASASRGPANDDSDGAESSEPLGTNQITDSSSEIDATNLGTLPPLASKLSPSHILQNNQLNRRLQKAIALQALGLTDWAKWELYEIEKKTVSKELIKTLIAKYSELKNYHRSSYLAQTHFVNLPLLNGQPLDMTFNGKVGPTGTTGIAGTSGTTEAKILWHDAYPRAYSEEVIEQSKRFEVPTGLIWGIMRAESHYRQDAMSPVGAMGLMQVMPRTAQRMSEKLGIKEFVSTYLLTPNFAIHIGTGYLKRLLGQFNQSTPLAAAAYNAGPHRVINWVRSFGNLQMDEFIEHIPFVETRNYVKKVVTNQQIYSELYQLNQDLVPMLSSNLQVSIPERMTASKESWEGP